MDQHHDRIVDTAETAAEHGTAANGFGDDWVHELIAMTRPGVELNFPFRGLRDRVVPFEFDDFD